MNIILQVVCAISFLALIGAVFYVLHRITEIPPSEKKPSPTPYHDILQILSTKEDGESNPDNLDRIRNTMMFLQNNPSVDEFLNRMTNGIR